MLTGGEHGGLVGDLVHEGVVLDQGSVDGALVEPVEVEQLGALVRVVP